MMEDSEMENSAAALAMALMMYANEPCRICGRQITAVDVKTAVFAGYSDVRPARAAHRECWDGMSDIVKSMSQKEMIREAMSALHYSVEAASIWTTNEVIMDSIEHAILILEKLEGCVNKILKQSD